MNYELVQQYIGEADDSLTAAEGLLRESIKNSGGKVPEWGSKLFPQEIIQEALSEFPRPTAGEDEKIRNDECPRNYIPTPTTI